MKLSTKQKALLATVCAMTGVALGMMFMYANLKFVIYASMAVMCIYVPCSFYYIFLEHFGVKNESNH